MKQFYEVVDRLSTEDWDSLGLTGISFEERMALKHTIKSISTRKFRPPKKGEWYLSGSIAEAYKAHNDLTTPFYIAKLVRTKTITTTIVCEV